MVQFIPAAIQAATTADKMMKVARGAAAVATLTSVAAKNKKKKKSYRYGRSGDVAEFISRFI